MSVRPDWRTIRRRDVLARPFATAAAEGACPHGVAVGADEPIVLLASQTVREPDGRRHVDLSGAEWHPYQCLAGGGA
jgi:hypothetical protein